MSETAVRHTNTPRPGYFALRAWSRGPLIPARIYRPLAIEPGTDHLCDRWPRLVAEIDGRPADLWAIWDYGKEISQEEFDFITTVTWPKYKDEYYAERERQRTVYRHSQVSVGYDEPQKEPDRQSTDEGWPFV